MNTTLSAASAPQHNALPPDPARLLAAPDRARPLERLALRLALALLLWTHRSSRDGRASATRRAHDSRTRDEALRLALRAGLLP